MTELVTSYLYTLLQPSILITIVIAFLIGYTYSNIVHLVNRYYQLLQYLYKLNTELIHTAQTLCKAFNINMSTLSKHSLQLMFKASLITLWTAVISAQYMVRYICSRTGINMIQYYTLRNMQLFFNIMFNLPMILVNAPTILYYLPTLLKAENRQQWLPLTYDLFNILHILLPNIRVILKHSKLLLPHTKQLVQSIPHLNQQQLQFCIEYLPELVPYYTQINDNIAAIQPYMSLILPYKIHLIRNIKYIAPHLNELAPFLPEIAARLPALVELKHVDSTHKHNNSPIRLDKNNGVIYKHTMLDRVCMHLDVIAPHIGPLLNQFDNLLPHYDAILLYAPYLLPHIKPIMASIDVVAPRLHRIEPYFSKLSVYTSFIFNTQVQAIWRDRTKIDVIINCIDMWVDSLLIISDCKPAILPLLYPIALHINQIQKYLPKTTVSESADETRSQPGSSKSPPVSPLKTQQSVSRLAAIKRLSGSQHSLSTMVNDTAKYEHCTKSILYAVAPYSQILADRMNELVPHLNILLPEIYDLLPLVDVFVTKIDSIIPSLGTSVTTPSELHQQLLLIRALPGYAKLSSYLNASPASVKKLGKSIFTASNAGSDISEGESDAENGDNTFHKRSSSYTSNLLNGATYVSRSIGSLKSYLRTPTGSRQPSPTRGEQKENKFVSPTKPERNAANTKSEPITERLEQPTARKLKFDSIAGTGVAITQPELIHNAISQLTHATDSPPSSINSRKLDGGSYSPSSNASSGSETKSVKLH